MLLANLVEKRSNEAMKITTNKDRGFWTCLNMHRCESMKLTIKVRRASRRSWSKRMNGNQRIIKQCANEKDEEPLILVQKEA